jgi:hypothetical protein
VHDEDGVLKILMLGGDDWGWDSFLFASSSFMMMMILRGLRVLRYEWETGWEQGNGKEWEGIEVFLCGLQQDIQMAGEENA